MRTATVACVLPFVCVLILNQVQQEGFGKCLVACLYVQVRRRKRSAHSYNEWFLKRSYCYWKDFDRVWDWREVKCKSLHFKSFLSEWEKKERSIFLLFGWFLGFLVCCWDATSSSVCSVCKWLKQGRHHFRSIACAESASPWVLEQYLEDRFSLQMSSIKFWLKPNSDYGKNKAFLSLKATHSSGRKGWASVSEGLLVAVLGVLGFSSVWAAVKYCRSGRRRKTLTALEEGSEHGLCFLECCSTKDFFNY